MEKPQLVNFIANILEDSGFKVYKNFKTTQQIVDIYAILPTSMGDFALVVGCKNYDKAWSVGIDVLKEMEMAGKNLKASKVCVITSSKFSEQALVYGEERHIKLVDRKGLIRLAKKYNDKKKEEEKSKEEEQNSSNDYYNITSGTYNEYGEYDNEYYDEDIDYNDYDEYDDNRYRAQYLNSSYYSQINRRNLNQRRPRASLNSRNVYQQQKLQQRAKYHSNLNRQNLFRQNSPQKTKKPNINYNQMQYRRAPQKPSKPLGETLKPILKNPVIGIAIVVIISYLISYVLGTVAKLPTGYLGLSELVVALIISYSIVFYADRDSKDPLIKGTAIFFISLIILMILIVLT